MPPGRPRTRASQPPTADTDTDDTETADMEEQPTGEQTVAQQVQEALSAFLPTLVAQVSTTLAQTLQPPSMGDDKDGEGGENSEEDDMAEEVGAHIRELSKSNRVVASSEDDQGELDELDFKYSLSEKECESVGRVDYLDFHKVFKRVHKQTRGPKINITFADQQYELDTTNGTDPELSVQDWVFVFLSFQSEHVRFFPHESPMLPRYMELILSMANDGHNWHKYDESFRMNRAKAAKRGKLTTSKYFNWGVTEVVSLFNCSGRASLIPHPLASVKSPQSFIPKPSTFAAAVPATYQTPYQTPYQMDKYKRPNTCWAYQTGTCEGACRWSDTHFCYECKGDHPTKQHEEIKRQQTERDRETRQPFREPRSSKGDRSSGRSRSLDVDRRRR